MKSRRFCSVFALLLFPFSNVAQEPISTPHGATTRPELVLQVGHANGINALAFSPDGKWLASGSDDLTIKIWDLATGSVVRTIQTGKPISALAVSPNARLLASGDGSRQVFSLGLGGEYSIDLWDVATGRKVRTLGIHGFSIQGLVFSRDGHELTSVSADALKRWDVDTGTGKSSFEMDYGKHHAGLAAIGRQEGAAVLAQAVVSPDGRFAAVASMNQPFKIYEVDNGRELTDTKVKADLETTIAFSPEGQLVAFLEKDKAVIRALSGGPDLHVLATGAAPFHAQGNVAFSPDGRTLVTLRQAVGADYRGEMKIWDTSTGALARDLGASVFNGSRPLASFSPNGQTIAEITGTGIKLINPVSGREDLVLSSGEKVPIEQTDAYKAFVTNPKAIAYLKKNAGVTTPEQIKAYFESHRGQMESSAAMLSSEESFLSFLPNQYKPKDVFAQDVFTFSPDGRWLVLRHEQMKTTTTQLWSTSTGVPAHNADVASLDSIGQPGLSPDGRFKAELPGGITARGALFSGFSRHRPNRNKDPYIYSEEVDLFDARSNSKLHAFSAGKSDQEFQPTSGFSSDGDLIAIGGFDDAHERKVFIYETVSGKKIAEVGGREQIRNMTVSSKARILAVGHDTQVELLDINTGRSLHILETGGAKSLTFNPSGRILGVADHSGNQELWDVTTGSKLATLVNLAGILGGDSKEWLVVTPDGLFDGSPAAWSHILWRFSGQTFDVAPVELFFNEFYYPGLLADILHGQRPKASHDIATRDRRQPHLTLASADGSASTSAPVSTRLVNLVITIGDAPAGARDVRLFRNGSLVKVWHGDVLKDASKVTLEASIPIVAGENKLTAYAFNQDNIKSQDAVLTIQGDVRLKRAGVLYVVTVGINAYANPEYNLKYAAADAQSFAEEVKRQQMKLGRFSRVEIANLTDKDATKANILLALKALSANNAVQSPGSLPETLQHLGSAQPEDGVIIYYAGHGTAQQSRFYLIPHDLGYSGNRANLNEESVQAILQHSISDQEIEQSLEEVDAVQVLLVIDACNSGQALETEEKRRGPMNSKGLAQLAYEKGMDILTAAQSYQAAQEAAQLGHGYLTYALVEEGLKTGAADVSPKDGQVDVREWLDYATSRVPEMQEAKLKETQAQGRHLSFVNNARGGSVEDQEVQRPRVFYRRDVQTPAFIVARTDK